MAERRRSLRARLGLWMVLSTTVTLVVFAIVVYVLVHAEASEGPASGDEGGSEQVLAAMLIAGPACLALAVTGAWILSRRALAPIDLVIQRAGAMTADHLRERLPLPAHNDELRHLVVVLNALFARLEAGFDALGTYAASASHELRTPLAVITNELEVALRRPRTLDDWERTARTALDEMRRLARLVEALLELSRAGASVTSTRRFELAEQLDQTLASLDVSVRPARIELADEIVEPIWLRGDAELLTGTVRELVWNAIRYAPSGSIVRVRVERYDGGRVAIHVDDRGPGVPPDERDAIFAPFHRGPAAARAPHGLGLGLAIARRSIEALGGTITVGSSPEGGARFTITVAMADPPSA